MTDIPRNTFHGKGPSLADLVTSSSTWEAAIVPLGPTFRKALAGVTVAVMSATVAAGWALDGAFEDVDEKPGLFVVGWPWFLSLLDTIRSLSPCYILLSVLLLTAAILTSGFAVAGRRLQIALAVIAVIGILTIAPAAAALAIPLANAIGWAVAAALLVAVILFGIFVMLDGL